MKQFNGIFWVGLCLGAAAAVAGAAVSSAAIALGGAAVLGACGLGAELGRRKTMKTMEAQVSKVREELALAQTERDAAEQTVAEVRSQELKLLRELSHVMRVPISIVVGYADLLMGGYVKEEASIMEYMGKIRDNVNYIDELLSQMLMEVRNNGSVPVLLVERLDVLELIREIAKDMSTVLISWGVAVQVSSSEEHIWLDGDATRLRKVFHNILENSLKYMEREGAINITCSLPDQEEVLIIVKDDGKGLAPQETEHIFELNYQGSNKRGGYGLGLHLVRETVRAHGGRISAKSDLGKGMGIYITLPVRCSTQERAPT